MSIKGYLHEKPPMGVVLLFLVSLATCLVVLAQYMVSTRVQDTTATKVYDEMLSKFVALTFCETNSSYTGTNNTEEETVELSFKLKVVVSGETSADGMESNIPAHWLLPLEKDFHDVKVKWFFSSPVKGSSNRTEAEACVVLSLDPNTLPSQIFNFLLILGGKTAHILPFFRPQFRAEIFQVVDFIGFQKSPSTSCVPSSGNTARNTLRTYLQQHPRHRKTPLQCKHGVHVEFQRHDTHKHIVYLSLWERSIIGHRLKVSSYIMAAIILTVFVYMYFKGSSIPIKSTLHDT